MASWKEFSRIVAEAKASKKLDPVGQEDADIDNDGDSDESDKYLKKRRDSVGAAIAADRKKKVEESKSLDPVGQEDDDIDNDGDKDKTDKYLLNRRKVRSKIIQTKVDEGNGLLGTLDTVARKTAGDIGGAIGEKEGRRRAGNLPILGDIGATVGRNRGTEQGQRTYDDVKNKAGQVLGGLLKQNYEPEGEQIDEFQLPGTGTVMAPKGMSLGYQQKFLGMNVGRRQEIPLNRTYGDSEIKNYNSNPKAPSKLEKMGSENGPLAGRAYSVAKPKPSPVASQATSSDGAVQGIRNAAAQGKGGGLLQRLNANRARTDAATASLNQSYEPEGEQIEEDREYRREMAKAAARERDEERRERGGRAAKSPGRTGPSAGKTYADHEELSIMGHDKVTKKAKILQGYPFPEQFEFSEARKKVKVDVKKPIGYRIADIGAGKKEYNVKTGTSQTCEAKDNSYLEPDMKKRRENNEKAIEDMKKTKAHKDMVATVRKKFDEETIAERGMSSDEMSSVLKGHKYSKLELLNMSKKSTKEGRHGEASAFYKEFQKNEEFEIEEGMTMKDFKQQRSRQKQKDKRESEKTSPLRRAGIHADKASPERAARHRANMDPDFEGNDEKNYPGGKLRPNKVRKAKAMGELGEGYIEEKSLSRAQQRFMGMVYAAKKGETPASPEVAKAASGISTKAARDFAKIKHEGLPEKKEETKEELSLVDRMIAEYGILDEAGNPALNMAASARRGEAAKKQSKRLGFAKLSTKANRVIDGKESKPSASSVKVGKGAKTGLERAAATTAAGRTKAAEKTGKYKIKAEEEKTKRQQARFARDDERRAEQKVKDEEKQQELRTKEKERRATSAEKSAEREYDEKKNKKDKLRKEIGQALSIKGPNVVSSRESDAKAIGSDVQSAGQLIGVVGKLAGVGINRMKEKRRESERKKAGQEAREKSLNSESFSNWREEFIYEVDDQSVQNDKQKVIDVSKKKNKIEINPNMSEGQGCDDNETPKKDMRGLSAKMSLIKTKLRLMGDKNPIVMVASEETDNIQEIAPLLAAAARIAGGTVARGVASKVAGSAAQGSLRSKAAEILGNKAGNLTTNLVKDKEEKKTEELPGQSFMAFLSKLGSGQAANEEVEIEELKK